MERLSAVLGGYADALSERGARLLLIHDGPRLRLNVRARSCLVGERITGRDPCVLTREASLHDRRPMDRVFEALAASRNDVVRWDYHHLLCPRACSVRAADGSLLMIDHKHVSRAASEGLAPALSGFLRSQLAPASAARAPATRS
jgi:hypothetical protein